MVGLYRDLSDLNKTSVKKFHVNDQSTVISQVSWNEIQNNRS